MTGDGPRSRSEFEAAVEALLVAAHENGVAVEDGIDVRSPDGDRPSWTVEVTRLREREP